MKTYTRQEVAALLGIKPATVMSRMRSRKMVKRGRYYHVFTKEDVERLRQPL